MTRMEIRESFVTSLSVCGWILNGCYITCTYVNMFESINVTLESE